MATFTEFVKMAKLSVSDKTSSKRMHQIISVLRKYMPLSDITPAKLVDMLEELGPTFVKMGQIVANRSDIFPKEYCEALDKLHADVTPMSFDEVIECINTSYGKDWKEVFLAIDPNPLGSASIAQAHRAILLDGTVVAVKVRRPGIVDEMHEDLTLMKRLLATAEFVTTKHEILLMSFDSLLDELEETTNEELDFNTELNNLIRFKAEIADQYGITCPTPYPKVSNTSVLVMEYVQGIFVDELGQLKTDGVDLDSIALRLVESYVGQVLDHGFFHADPHPGNILINGEEIIWIDLGMTGELSASQRQLVSQMFRAVTSNDAYLLMNAVVGISNKRGRVSYSQLLQQLSDLLDKYGSADVGNLDIGDILSELMDILREQNLVATPSITMLARGFVTLEGVAEKLSPTLNVLDVVSRYVLKSTLQPKYLATKSLETAVTAVSSAEALLSLPMQVSNTIDMLDKGEIELTGNIKVERAALATIYASVGRMSLSLISVGLFLGSSILCTTSMDPKILGVPVLGVLGYIGAFILGVYVIVQTFKSRHQMKNNEDLD